MSLSKTIFSRLFHVSSATLKATSRMTPPRRLPLVRMASQQTITKPNEHYTLELSKDKNMLTVAGESMPKERFHAVWLRHVCQCPECREEDCDQRKIDPVKLQAKYSINQTHIQDEKLFIEWKEDGHRGYVPLSLLARSTYSREALEARTRAKIPNVCTGEVPKISYKELIESEEGVWKWVKDLNDKGICLIRGVPDEVTVNEVASFIWTPQSTFFGDTFVVESLPRPINLAYTTLNLPMHMDMPYSDTMPGYQLLLCKKFDDCITGGDNTFVDAWYEADRMRRLHPDQFDVLARVPVTFRLTQDETRELPVKMYYTQPHFVLDKYNGQIESVRWSPVTETPLLAREEDVEPYFRAHLTYAKLLASSESKIEIRLKPGDLITFNNRRLLHGRKDFQLNGGHRRLEGCYINVDEMRSQAEILSSRYNEGRPIKFAF